MSNFTHGMSQLWHVWDHLFVGLPFYDHGLPFVALLGVLMGFGVVLKRMFEN